MLPKNVKFDRKKQTVFIVIQFQNKRTYAKNDGKQVLLLLTTGNSINAPRKPRTAKPWMQDGFITNESRNSLALPPVAVGIMVF